MIVIESRDVAWVCLQTLPKHEHIAAARLRRMEEIEAFLPRIRFKRATRQGPVWVTEALFPGYLFARFNWQVSRRQVEYASGVRNIVHFGDYIPAIPDVVIDDLREMFGATELRTISDELISGDAVQIAEGALRGLRAVVDRIIPGRERVAVLMELLGQETAIELPVGSLIKEGAERAILSQGLGCARH